MASIHDLRAKRGLGQTALAEQVGVMRHTSFATEQEKYAPSSLFSRLYCRSSHHPAFHRGLT